MKNWKYIVWALFVLLGTACEEIALPATALLVQENKADVSPTSATLTIKLEPIAATIQAMNVYYSLSSNMSDSQKMAMKKVDESTYTAVLVNLKEETTYYVQYEALNAFSSTRDKNTYDFKTKKQVVLPTVVTSAVTQITVSSAVMGGNVTSDGGATVTERGVVYSTSQNPDINDINNFICPCGSGTGEFTYNATTLQANTTYYVRAYAKNEKGTAYGEQVSFTTAEEISETPVYVDLGLPSGIKWADRNVGATKPWEYGDHFAWGETSTKDNYSEETYSHVKVIRASYVIAKYKGSDYSILLAEDDAATAKWGGEWRMPTKEERDELYEYCNWEWTTKNGVEGYKVTSKQNGNSIFLPLAGSVDGDWTNTAYGFYWTSTVNTENTWNAYDINFTSSSVLMNDDVRVYGRSVRPVYGSRAAVMPVVVTSAVTQITENSAVLGGNVTYDGNATVTERGVVYSTSPNPVITNLNNFIRPCGSGTGEFTYNATTLQANTTYYVRAYAKNGKGTAYGAEVSFTTNNQVVVPTVTTTAATQVTETTAVTGGNVTSDGGATVTERGVVYSTSHNPTTSNSKVKNGTGTGSFTCNLTGLQANTTYYVRAYAVNSKGTAYGAEVSFTTDNQVIVPTVTTTAATQITATTAVTGGYVASDGGASVTERGVVYSTSQNPTTSNSKVKNGSGIGYFTCNLTGLQANRTYYVRAYAVNSKGTAYGTQVSFTTSIALPTITTATATQITATTAVTGGNVTSDGGASVTERGVVYSTSQNPTTSNSKVKNGSGTGSFTCNLTGLQANTTYYIRAYAVNSKGTAYGTQVSFTTKSIAVPQYVDLGLSVKWATFNVGASKPEDYGDYFAWGETQPKTSYSESNYSYTNNPTTLPLSADAAHANWGGSWRIPTDAEMTELREQCTWTWITQNGVNGYKVTGTDGNSIFLPAAGCRYDSSLNLAGSLGHYWSSSLNTGSPSNAWYVSFVSSSVSRVDYIRSGGRSVRPVCP